LWGERSQLEKRRRNAARKKREDNSAATWKKGKGVEGQPLLGYGVGTPPYPGENKVEKGKGPGGLLELLV